jgi:hypothetical protein
VHLTKKTLRQMKGTLADSIRELSRICAEEGYILEVPTREWQARPNPFTELPPPAPESPAATVPG